MSKTEELTQQLQQQASNKIPMPQTIEGMLKDARFINQINKALPKHMNADRIARIALTEIRKNPKLGQADPLSLFGAVIQSSQIGLEFGNGLGHAYLVPYNNKKTRRLEVNLIPGYKGFIDLAWRSGKVKSIHADAVYAKDKFSFCLGTDSFLKHVPNIDEVDRGELVAAYCVVHTINGGHVFKPIGKAAALRAKASSPSADKDYSIWKSDEEAMWIKTAVRRLFKFMPVSVEIQRAVQLDDLADVGEQNNIDFLNDVNVFDGEFTNENEAA